ncbi:MAG: hypothetical protein LBI27_08155, partial [Clostridiales bacterium]|nr:hypothetical protein [Clostridiales bacterium]
MEANVVIFIVMSLVACISLAYLLLLLWSADTRDKRLRSFFRLCSVVLVWTFLNLLTVVVKPEHYEFVYKLKIIVVCILPYLTCWFFLNLAKSRLTNSKLFLGLLIAISALDILAMLTNPWHELYFTNYAYPNFSHGLLFFVHLGFATTIIVLAYIIVLRHVIGNFRHRPMMILAGVCAILPYFLNIIFLFR